MSETPSSPEPERPEDPRSPAPNAEAPAGDDPTPGAAPRADDPAAGEAPTTASPPPPRRLLRSRDDRVIGGVCGGLARYFGIDPLIVRIAFVALTFVGGFALIAYVAALAFVPEDDGTGQPRRDTNPRTTTILGATAIVLAGIALASGGWWGAGWLLGPLIPIIVVGGLLALAGYRLLRDRGEARPTAGRIAGAAFLVLAVLIAAGVAFFAAAWAAAAGGAVAVAAVVIALGVAMVVLALQGRTRVARWMAPAALVLAIPAGVVSAAGVDVHGGVGKRLYRPVTAGNLPDQYRLGVGELRIDLREMRWPTDRPVSLRVDEGIGHTLVLVPADACVQVAAHVGAGYVGVLGDETGGADVNYDVGSVAHASGPRLILHADMGMGALEIRHNPAPDGNPGHFNGPSDGITPQLANAGCAGTVR